MTLGEGKAGVIGKGNVQPSEVLGMFYFFTWVELTQIHSAIIKVVCLQPMCFVHKYMFYFTHIK